MAFGSIELTTISRAQDYSMIKQNEDNHAALEQNLIENQIEKNQMQKMRDVTETEASRWADEKFDAREEGKGHYQGDGGSKRPVKKPVKDQVLSKERKGFDIKI